MKLKLGKMGEGLQYGVYEQSFGAAGLRYGLCEGQPQVLKAHLSQHGAQQWLYPCHLIPQPGTQVWCTLQACNT